MFSVAINGTTVLSNFDIVAAAGAAFKANVQEFNAQADAGGQITIAYIQGPVDQPKSSGIEILAAGTAGTLPPPWTDADIGAVGIPGSASFASASGTFTIQASGDDIWNTADGFHFVYQPLNGDGAILARVASVGNTDSWAKAGVMIRETLAANSTQAMMVITPGNGSAFQRRTSTGGSSTHTPGPNVTAPYWVKIERSGTTFTGSVSADGSSWTVVGSDTISMAGTVSIGLAVTAHNNGLLNTSTIDHVSLSSGGGSPGGIAIDAGGPAAGAFTADQAFSGGTVSSGTSSPIDTSGVAGPAPQIVYQTGRYGNFSYTPGGLSAGAPYRVRLHFAEYIYSSSGSRVFNVAINGAQVLTNFDIFQAAGAMNKALVQEFNATASGGGTITIAFSSVVDNSIIQGLEIVPQAVAIAINAGGGAVGAFESDTSFSGGSVSRGTTAAIDTSGVSNPAPQAVYQTGRFGNFSYSFSGLAPGGTGQVRLHFAEYIYSSSGSRVFNVAINGTSVLSNFDIFAAAGAMNKAVVRTFTVTADSSGGVVISFTSVVDNSIIQGLELQSP